MTPSLQGEAPTPGPAWESWSPRTTWRFSSLEVLCAANEPSDNCIDVISLLSREEEAKVFTPEEGAEKFTFQAEVNRLMDIIIHSLYSNKVCEQQAWL